MSRHNAIEESSLGVKAHGNSKVEHPFRGTEGRLGGAEFAIERSMK